MKHIFTSITEFITESTNNGNKIFYHGSTDDKLGGKNGIHVGTYQAAKEALQARIGVPAEGEWDGTRVYGDTLLVGKKTIRTEEYNKNYIGTGYNCGRDLPDDDYLPTDRNTRAMYSDGSLVPFDCKPIIFPVKIIGNMTNTPSTPYGDTKANSMMKRNLKLGNARSGYYYKNEGEDVGSISAVVPDKSFLSTDI